MIEWNDGSVDRKREMSELASLDASPAPIGPLGLPIPDVSILLASLIEFDE